MIQIALFSAIVATFFVQSLTGLSQDSADTTNELLRNLTELIIIVSQVDASQLNLPSPSPFEPDGDAVRLNFYWSISLILSVSIHDFLVLGKLTAETLLARFLWPL